MADITLGDLLTLICTEMSQTLQQTKNNSELLKLQVNDVDLEIPAHLSLQPAQQANDSARLMVGLPSTRETPPALRLGRIRISIEAQQLPSP